LLFQWARNEEEEKRKKETLLVGTFHIYIFNSC
jgi:hypothetical protein